jgi:CopG antitoxin of type II toxin-antitoxin system
MAKNKRLKRVPKFANEAAERAFWEKNDATPYVDWKKAQAAKVVVGRAGRYTSQDVHNVLFPKKAPKGRPADAKEAIRTYIRKRHTRLP